LRKRKVWVEPLFAEAKDWHGMRRFRLRRLEKVNMETLLIASGQNVKRLLAFGVRRPKNPAQAAALRAPAASGYDIGYARKHRMSRFWQPTKDFFNRLDPPLQHHLALTCPEAPILARFWVYLGDFEHLRNPFAPQ
jgi:hypothetical protein